MSPRRRSLLIGVALALLVAGAFTGLGRLLTGDEAGATTDQSVAGPVLLVPGYGGATGSLEVLAVALRAEGRSATIVAVPGDGTGDLALSVAALDAAAEAAGTPVDVIGFSAGGVVSRLWAREEPSSVRRVVTLGSPHHGTKVAALGSALIPGACPVACQQLVPGSPLLDGLNGGDETPDGPQWLALWTAQDQTVTPPDSARLEGAVNVELQRLCPGLTVDHTRLPVDPTVIRVVLAALGGPDLEAPTAAVCA